MTTFSKMMSPARMLLVLGCCFGFGCTDAEKSAQGFRLPDGDVNAGERAFLDLKCHSCHRVEGMEFPDPVADPEVPVVLGGDTHYIRSDGELVSSIINPSHRLAKGFPLAPGYPSEQISAGGGSRMADYSDVMTVRQLVDLVAFLHTRYALVPATPVR